MFCSIMFLGCESPEISDESSVTEQFKKIETKYQEGSTKNENTQTKENRWIASKELTERVKRETAALYATNVKRYSSARTIFNGYDVGVIPEGASCPLWSEFIRFFMDNEDESPSTTGAYWVGAWLVNDSHRNTHAIFCRVDGRLLPENARYSVLALGNQRADAFEGTSEMYIDNEDGSNANYSEGDIYPNISTSNTILYIHSSIENVTATPSAFPDFGFRYAVFSGSISNPIAYGYAITDDQNGGNVNHISYESGQTGIAYQNYYNGELLYCSVPGITSYRNWGIPATGMSQERSGTEFLFSVVK
jgi:hypothetical protein